MKNTAEQFLAYALLAVVMLLIYLVIGFIVDMIFGVLHLLKAGDDFVKVSADHIEEFVHKFRLLHFRNVGYCQFAGSFHPTSFCVGAAAARED